MKFRVTFSLLVCFVVVTVLVGMEFLEGCIVFLRILLCGSNNGYCCRCGRFGWGFTIFVVDSARFIACMLVLAGFIIYVVDLAVLLSVWWFLRVLLFWRVLLSVC